MENRDFAGFREKNAQSVAGENKATSSWIFCPSTHDLRIGRSGGFDWCLPVIKPEGPETSPLRHFDDTKRESRVTGFCRSQGQFFVWGICFGAAVCVPTGRYFYFHLTVDAGDLCTFQNLATEIEAGSPNRRHPQGEYVTRLCYPPPPPPPPPPIFTKMPWMDSILHHLKDGWHLQANHY